MPINLYSMTLRAQRIYRGEEVDDKALAGPGAPPLLLVTCEDCAAVTVTRRPLLLIACGWWVETRGLHEKPEDFTHVAGVCPACLGSLPLMQTVTCSGRDEGETCRHVATAVDLRALRRAGWVSVNTDDGEKWYCHVCAGTIRKGHNKRALIGFTFKANLKSRPYQASIQVNRKLINLGLYATPEEAARAYDKASWDARHNLKKLNFPAEYAKLAESRTQRGTNANQNR